MLSHRIYGWVDDWLRGPTIQVIPPVGCAFNNSEIIWVLGISYHFFSLLFFLSNHSLLGYPSESRLRISLEEKISNTITKEWNAFPFSLSLHNCRCCEREHRIWLIAVLLFGSVKLSIRISHKMIGKEIFWWNQILEHRMK